MRVKMLSSLLTIISHKPLSHIRRLCALVITYPDIVHFFFSLSLSLFFWTPFQKFFSLSFTLLLFADMSIAFTFAGGVAFCLAFGWWFPRAAAAFVGAAMTLISVSIPRINSASSLSRRIF
jgi:hypothetical protein